MASRISLKLTVHEREFVDLHVLDGYPLYRAYLKAFEHRAMRWGVKHKNQQAATQASLIIRRPHIQEYIVELKRRAEKESQRQRFLSLDEKRDFLARAVRTPVGLIDEHDELAQEIQFTRDGKKIKAVDKLRALETDAKLAGELRDKLDIEVSPKVIDMSESMI